MSLKDKLKQLVEKEISKTTTQKLNESRAELSGMSDQELISLANQAGIEELIVKDGSGALARDSKEEIITSLCNLENSEDDLTEDEQGQDDLDDLDDSDDSYDSDDSDEELWWSGEKLEISMTLDQAESVSVGGQDNEQAVRELLRDPKIQSQVSKWSAEDVREELDGYGAWDDTELQDEKMNLVRLLWIAGGYISDEAFMDQNESAKINEAPEDESDSVFFGKFKKKTDELPKDDEQVVPDDKPIEPEDEAEGDEKSEEDKITVVVISPELKKDDEEDDKLQNSYDLESKGQDKNLINTNEHVEALFSGETLSEDFKEKAAVIFEAALQEHTKALRNKFVKEFRIREAKIQAKFDKQVLDLKESLIVEQAKLVDGYLEEATDTWIAENQMVLESNIKVELSENFIDGLKALFSESYIEVPEEKFDLIKSQERKIKELEESLKSEKISNRKNLKEAKRLHVEAVLNRQTSDLTEVEKAKFLKLVESVDYDSIEQFEKKVKTLKESYTRKTSDKQRVLEESRNKKVDTQVNITESVEEVTPVDEIASALSIFSARD